MTESNKTESRTRYFWCLGQDLFFYIVTWLTGKFCVVWLLKLPTTWSTCYFKKKNWKIYLGNWLYKNNILFICFNPRRFSQHNLQNKYNPQNLDNFYISYFGYLSVSYFVWPTAYLWHVYSKVSFWALHYGFVQLLIYVITFIK